MSREQKLSLVIAFGLVLLVGVLISDHLSRARQLDLVPVEVDESNILALDVHAPERTIRPTRYPPGLHEGTPTEPTTREPTTREPGSRDPNRGTPSTEGEPDVVPHEPPVSPTDSGRPSRLSPPRDHLTERGRDLAHAGNGRTIDAPIEIRQGGSTMIDRLVDNGGSLINHAIESGRRLLDDPRAAAIEDAPKARATETTLAESDDNADLAGPSVWHVVARGESLSKISKAYYGKASDWRRIAAVNDVGENGMVNAGDRLRIPGVEQKKPVKTASKTSTYTVKAGDTLGQIAMQTLGTVGELPRLMEANGLDDADVIRVGMVLKLPESP